MTHMCPASEPFVLAAEFAAASREQWRDLVSAVVRTAGVDDVERALSGTTYDGITVAPLYTADDASGPLGVPGRPPFVRGASAAGAVLTGWDVRQRHTDPDPLRANRAVLDDLAHGVSSLWVVLGAAGLAVADLPAALAGVRLDLAPIALDAGAQTPAAVDALFALAVASGVAPDQLAGTLGADPIGWRARSGVPAELTVLGELAERVSDAPHLRVATVDATVYHDAGGSDSDELAVATSVGVAYLRALTDAGRDVDAALAALEFRFAVSADQFLSIAKLRAARRIWDRVAELSGASAQRRGQRQHAVTSAAMMTRRDPWVNMLRTTIACFAAAVGGADAITVAPFDAAIGLPDDFARRIARNTQAILHDEASLARVLDAAGGSWYVESLTDALAEKAWTTFTAVERAGGALAALDDATIGRLLGTARDRRRADIAHRRAPITGVSEFALITEAPVVRAAPAQVEDVSLLPTIRYAQDFEALRDRSDRHVAMHGTRPAVFLAALGPTAAHGARVAFAANLFQAGGIEPVSSSGDVATIVEEFRASGSSVACLCSSDRAYAGTAADTARALRQAGATYLWLAGRPGERAASDAAAGIDGYVHTGADAIAILDRTLAALGVSG